MAPIRATVTRSERLMHGRVLLSSLLKFILPYFLSSFFPSTPLCIFPNTSDRCFIPYLLQDFLPHFTHYFLTSFKCIPEIEELIYVISRVCGDDGDGDEEE